MLESLYPLMLNLHRSVWLLLVIVFFIAYILLTKEKQKGYFISHQIARVFYIVMIVSGAWNLIYIATLGGDFPWNYTAKGVIALWLIYLMEAILGKKKRGEFTENVRMYYWGQLGIAILVIILIGYNVIL